MNHRVVTAAGVSLALGCGGAASGQLTLVDSFSPGIGDLVAVGFDPATDLVWTHAGFETNMWSYTRAGAAQTSIARPGGNADDFDLFIAPEPVDIGGTVVPKDTLLVVNGESGVAEVYAVNKATGAVLATLVTAFGQSHVVGATYHAGRNTLFLVQDRNASTASQRSLIAEINPITGAVINTFGTGSAAWTVNYGDIEAHPTTGHLWVVSSDETTTRVFTPTGAFVAEHALPVAVGALSGIGFDVARGEAWVSNPTTDALHRLGGVSAPVCAGDVNSDGVVNISDFNILAGHFGQLLNATFGEGDLNLDGAVNISDFNILASNFATVCP